MWSPSSWPSLKMCHLKRDGKPYQPGNVFTCMKSSDSSHRFWCMRKSLGKQQNMGSMWKMLQKEIDLGDPTPWIDKCIFGCTQREAKVDARAVQSKNELFKKLMTTREAEEEDETKEHIRWKRSLWIRDTKGHAQNCVEKCCELEERCVFSSASSNTTHEISPDTSQKVMKPGSSLRDVLELSWYACNWQELDDQIYYGQ